MRRSKRLRRASERWVNQGVALKTPKQLSRKEERRNYFESLERATSISLFAWADKKVKGGHSKCFRWYFVTFIQKWWTIFLVVHFFCLRASRPPTDRGQTQRRERDTDLPMHILPSIAPPWTSVTFEQRTQIMLWFMLHQMPNAECRHRQQNTTSISSFLTSNKHDKTSTRRMLLSWFDR